jgi:hypothetical protein
LESRTGDPDRGVAHFEEALQLALDCGDTYHAGVIEHSLGDVALADGETARAEGFYLRSLRHGRELDHLPTIAYCLAGLASTAAMRGQQERAGRLWGASEAFQRTADMELLEHHRLRYEEAIAAVACPEFDDVVSAMRKLPQEEALAAALPDEL